MSNAFSNTKSSGIWCNIAGGKVRRSAQEGDEGAVAIEKKDREGKGTGEFKYFLVNDRVEGRIVDIRTQTQTFKGEDLHQLVVTIENAGERINVTMKQGDRYWRAFMVRLPNVDLEKPVIFAPFDFKDKKTSKDIIGMNLLQHPGPDKVEPYFTKDDQKGMPDMQKVTYKGKERADFTAQDEWLLKNVLEAAKVALGGEPERVDKNEDQAF